MRRSIPEIVEPHGPVSCISPWVYTYDANGHRRWCGDCGAELGANEPVDPVWLTMEETGGVDVSSAMIAAFVAGVAIILALVLLLVAPEGQPANSDGPGGAPMGPGGVPAPYDPPEWRPSTVPDAGLRPYFNEPS